MLDYFSNLRYKTKQLKSKKNKKEDEDETVKKCTAPFSGWGGPLQVPSKIIFTIGDFFGCLVCIAFILHVIILLGTHGTAEVSKKKIDPQTYSEKKTRSKFWAIFNYVAHEITGRESDNDEVDDHYGAVSVSLFFMWLFGLNFANLAIIPIFTFTRFSYFAKGGGPFTPILRAIYSPLTFLESNKISRHILAAFYLIYFVVFIIYAIAAYLGGSSWAFTGLDRMLLGVIIVIPVARICIMLVSYAIHSWISFFYSVTCNRNRLLRLKTFKSMRAIPKIQFNTDNPETIGNNHNIINEETHSKNDENEELDSINDNVDIVNSNDSNKDENKDDSNIDIEEISGINSVETNYVFTSNNNNEAIAKKINNFIEKNNTNKIPDHDNMNSIRSTTFDGGFDSPFDYCPKFARADPFLYSIYGQSTLCTWHCAPDGRTNSWSAAWELYHIAVAIATCIYIIYIGSKSEQCNGNCVGFIFTFILVIIPLTIRVRFPFFVIHSAFSCIPKIDDLFECFGCCKCFGKNKKGCGCDCDCKCQQCLTEAFNKCCNRGSENLGLNEIQDDFSMEEAYGSDGEEEVVEIEQLPDPDNRSRKRRPKNNTEDKNNENNEDDGDNINNTVVNNGESTGNSRVNINTYYRRRRTSELEDNEPKEKKKVFKNFELLALSSKGLGIMSAVIYLIIIAIMLVVTVFILSNFAFDLRRYDPYNLNMTKYEEGRQTANKKYPTKYRFPRHILEQISQPISEMCYVKPHGLNMLQYFLLADLSYYDIFSGSATAAIDEFFPKEEINISSMGQMNLHEYSFGAMSYFNFDNLDLSVVAIRGSTEGVDWALDIQFFLSSALLTISAPLNFFTKDDTPRTMRTIRLILAYPLHLMEKFTLFYKFYDDLMSYYETIPLKNNVVFVGHSLGGGLAKLFGHVIGRAAISISGPGITLFQTIKKGARKDIFSLLSETDIVPDSDLVPRVEQTAATRYRILCNQGMGTCHFIKHTLCMATIMCNVDHENFCRSFNDSTISDLYDTMVSYATDQ